MTIDRVSRRAFLKAAGVLIAIPPLESLGSATATGKSKAPPRRMVCVGNEFGMYPGAFWPEKSGANYETTALLQPLGPLRREFTLFSHLDHGLKGTRTALTIFYSSFA